MKKRYVVLMGVLGLGFIGFLSDRMDRIEEMKLKTIERSNFFEDNRYDFEIVKNNKDELKRMEVRIALRPNFTKENIEYVANNILERLKDEKFTALKIYLHESNKLADGYASMGYIDYAPNGDWSEAYKYINSIDYNKMNMQFKYDNVRGEKDENYILTDDEAVVYNTFNKNYIDYTVNNTEIFGKELEENIIKIVAKELSITEKEVSDIIYKKYKFDYDI